MLTERASQLALILSAAMLAVMVVGLSMASHATAAEDHAAVHQARQYLSPLAGEQAVARAQPLVRWTTTGRAVIFPDLVVPCTAIRIPGNCQAGPYFQGPFVCLDHDQRVHGGGYVSSLTAFVPRCGG